MPYISQPSFVFRYIPTLTRYTYPIFKIRQLEKTALDKTWINLLCAAQQQDISIRKTKLPSVILQAYKRLLATNLPRVYKQWYVTQSWPDDKFIVV